MPRHPVVLTTEQEAAVDALNAALLAVRKTGMAVGTISMAEEQLETVHFDTAWRDHDGIRWVYLESLPISRRAETL